MYPNDHYCNYIQSMVINLLFIDLIVHDEIEIIEGRNGNEGSRDDDGFPDSVAQPKHFRFFHWLANCILGQYKGL